MSRKRTSGRATQLEDFIRDSVDRAIVTRLAIAAEQAGDDLTRDILKDDVFRERFHQLARRMAEDTLARLSKAGE